METAAQGYFVKNYVLMCKWCPQADNFVGKSIVQIGTWAFLQPYHLDICHVKGSKNVMADGFSRAF